MENKGAATTDIKIELSRPIALGSDSHTTITLREPLAGDLEDIDLDVHRKGVKLNTTSILEIAERIVAEPPAIIRRLPLVDFMTLSLEVIRLATPFEAA